ncbi:hypothetical protein FKM82_017684 [Ascaphus truei]
MGNWTNSKFPLITAKSIFIFRKTIFLSEPEIGFILSNITGGVLVWAAPILAQNNPLLENYNDFNVEFKKASARRASTQPAEYALLELRQGSNDLSTYILTLKN